MTGPFAFLKDIKALIVEDSPTQAFQLKESLENIDFKVVAANNGLEALEKLSIENPDIIITDVDMPKMNGYEFCKLVKADSRFQNIPVIILTSLSDTMDVIHGIECGADSFMTKPLDLELFISFVNDAFQNKKLQKAQLPSQNVTFFFGGVLYHLKVNQTQIIDLLLSTYTNAIHKNLELEQTYKRLHVVHQDLEKKNIELRKLDEEKNQFLGMAAHDMRNPLSVIGGFSEILKEKLNGKVDDPSVFKMIDRINKTSSFMLNLINDLLDISSIESGKVILNLRPVDLTKLLNDLIVFQQYTASKKDIEIIFKQSEKSYEILCDREKVEQVLNNLISNAIKFSNQKSKVEVYLGQTEQGITIQVVDHGVGIPISEKQNIFKPFAKGSIKGTAGESSTGLGLVIVKKIIDAHHGTIGVDSEPGKGSIFSITLPLAVNCR